MTPDYIDSKELDLLRKDRKVQLHYRSELFKERKRRLEVKDNIRSS